MLIFLCRDRICGKLCKQFGLQAGLRHGSRLAEYSAWYKVAENSAWYKVAENLAWYKVAENSAWYKVDEISAWYKVDENQHDLKWQNMGPNPSFFICNKRSK